VWRGEREVEKPPPHRQLKGEKKQKKLVKSRRVEGEECRSKDHVVHGGNGLETLVIWKITKERKRAIGSVRAGNGTR